MYVATIVRDKKNGRIYVRIGDAAQTGGNVEVVEILNGVGRTDLERRAERFADELRDQEDSS